MAAPNEPRNPFYLLLLIMGLIFIVTVLIVAVLPVVEQKARDAGQEVPPREESWFRNTMHHHGGMIVLGEVAALVILGLLSMGLDRWRRWQAEAEIPLENPAIRSEESGVQEKQSNTATDETRIKHG